ncbi:hypothetical protein [Pedococcus sp. 2YAF34]|uniref:hypothetical protein n=1 Tax=Pedococcus sp. 2YAF34 TaxID=3233032 RepID=UPI003F9D5F2E
MKESHTKRLADLSTYGDSQLYLFAFLILGTVAGGLIGWPTGYPGEAAGAGAGIGLITWVVLVVRAHLDLVDYRGTHREEDNGDDEVEPGDELRPR